MSEPSLVHHVATERNDRSFGQVQIMSVMTFGMQTCQEFARSTTKVQRSGGLLKKINYMLQPRFGLEHSLVQMPCCGQLATP